MKISMDWLKEYVETDLSVSEVIDVLNMIGLVVDEWEESGDDVILDLETYANRPDTLGHLGVARELAAATGSPMREQNWHLPGKGEATSELAEVQIWDENLCPRYCGILVRNVRVGPSPDWLTKRIRAMGLNPISNVVDVTNYVLFATAQPIHSFDWAKVQGEKIIIRKAKKGEMLRTLDKEDVQLSSDMLVIADEKIPIALAGVIGGEKSGIGTSTRDVFIESACFDPISIRMTSKKIGIQTDASYRFERGADPSFAPEAARMAASLLARLGGQPTVGIIDVYPKPRKEKSVILRHNRIMELLGMKVEKDFIERTFSDLGFSVEKQNEEAWKIYVPAFRVDIDREADLIEEVARFYGYEKIPSVFVPLKEMPPVSESKQRRINGIRHVFLHEGFDEALNFSFMDPEKLNVFETTNEPIGIRNPVSTKASVLRTTLLDGLLANVAWNVNRGVEGVHLFEVGNTYLWVNDSRLEKLSLGFVATGKVGEAHWKKGQDETDFFRIKGTCESFMTHLNFVPYSFQQKEHSFFQTGFCLALLYKGEIIGHLGKLKEKILAAFSLKETVYAAELNIGSLLARQPSPLIYKPVGKYPSVVRDMSFIVDQKVTYNELKEGVDSLSIPTLESFELYDRFSGSSIPIGTVSLSFRFVFRHPERTLLTEEVDNFLKRIMASIGKKFSVQLREGGKIDN
ncbi:MAG: phenylalanine--tRNA ligase subunit beta [Candidatus Aminicenantes bacterium]|nr:phenylalanine--tRNA ligase subunit beta [Candidatus Aminicenantes bacterium]